MMPPRHKLRATARADDETETAVCSDFRLILRDQTRAAHDRLDRLISGLDITSIDGFERFCRIHIHMFEAIRPFDETSATTELLAALHIDIKIVSEQRDRCSPRHLDRLHPLAVAYIAEGSRMGTQVLAKRWTLATDPQVNSAKTYFGLTPTPDRWRDICAKLRDLPAGSDCAKTIKLDVLRIFDLFADTYDQYSDRMNTNPSRDPEQTD